MNLIPESKVYKHIILPLKVQMIKKVPKMLLNKVKKVVKNKNLNLRKFSLNK